MDDIFISYASENKELMKKIRRALERKSHSVFTDEKLSDEGNNGRFDEIIEEKITNCIFFVVLWSTHAQKKAVGLEMK